jgi:hypothetical protein
VFSILAVMAKSKTSVYYIEQLLVHTLVRVRLLSRDFEPCGMKFMHIYVVISVAKVILLRNLGTFGIMFLNMCDYYCGFPRYS